MAATEVKVPDIGDFKNIPVIELLVKPGDAVKKDDSLLVLESDKATLEVPSPGAGVIAELKVKVGDKVSAGTLVALLEGSAAPAVTNGNGHAKASAAPAAVAPPAPAPAPQKAQAPARPRTRRGSAVGGASTLARARRSTYCSRRRTGRAPGRSGRPTRQRWGRRGRGGSSR